MWVQIGEMCNFFQEISFTFLFLRTKQWSDLWCETWLTTRVRVTLSRCLSMTVKCSFLEFTTRLTTQFLLLCITKLVTIYHFFLCFFLRERKFEFFCGKSLSWCKSVLDQPRSERSELTLESCNAETSKSGTKARRTQMHPSNWEISAFQGCKPKKVTNFTKNLTQYVNSLLSRFDWFPGSLLSRGPIC